MSKTFIATGLKGSTFDFAGPRPEDVDLDHIATGLAYTNRFNGLFGQIPVASHCIAVERLANADGADLSVRRWALLHDAHEAYIGDVPTPLKRVWGDAIARVESAVERAVAEAFDVLIDEVHKWDIIALRLEAEWFTGQASTYFRNISVQDHHRDVFRDCVPMYRAHPDTIKTEYLRACDRLAIRVP